MTKEKRRGALWALLVFPLQFVVWGVWQGLLLPRLALSPAALTLLDCVLVKGLIWALPPVLLLLLGKGDRLCSLRELFPKRFPVFACTVLLCLTTVFLYTLRLTRGLVNTHAVFDPMILVLSLSAGVWEELGFRGGLFNLLQPHLGFWGAALLNGVCFALFHFPTLLTGTPLTALLSWRALLTSPWAWCSA